MATPATCRFFITTGIVSARSVVGLNSDAAAHPGQDEPGQAAPRETTLRPLLPRHRDLEALLR